MSQSATRTPPMTHDDTAGPGLTAGVDLGGTNIQVGIIRPDARIVGRAKLKTDPDAGYEAVVDRVIRGVREACADAGADFDQLACIGVGTPGPVDPRTGVVLEAVNLRWDNAPLRASLSAKTGRPVSVENDVNAAIFGEWKHGAGRGASDLLAVWVGTGVGGGLVLKGQPFSGHFHTAGEIGHMILVPGAAPGSRSLEHNCSRTAIADRITQLIRANRKSALADTVRDGKRLKSRTIAEAYQSGDELACEVINDSADRLGMAVGSIATLLSLERAVIGGGLTEALGEPYVSRIRAAAIREAFPKAVKQIEVVESALGDDAGIIGAGLLALHNLGV